MVLSWWGEGGREAVRGLGPHPGLFELVLASPGRAKTGDEDLCKVRGKGRPSTVKPAGRPTCRSREETIPIPSLAYSLFLFFAL